MTEAEEFERMRLENKIRIQMARDILAKVVIGEGCGVTAEEYVAMAKPMALKVDAMLAAESEG